MTKIKILGMGTGGTIDMYNTCFVIQKTKGNIIVPNDLEEICLVRKKGEMKE